MSSSDNPEIKDRGKKDEDNSEEKGGFIEKVKDFINDIGEKIEEAIGFGKPTADVTGVHIPKINLKMAEFVVDVLIKNPNPVPIPLVDINYSVESDGRKLVSGLIPDAGTIHARGSETVKIPMTLIYDDIKSTYKDIRPGSIIPYQVKVDLIVDVPIFGNLTLPLKKTGEIPVPYKPDVDIDKIKFEKFSLEETVATLHLSLENKNDFDLGLNVFEYEIWLSDVSIGSAELAKSRKLEQHAITKMEIPITFRPKDFGSAVWDMIRRRGTGYSMRGNIDANTPFGQMKLPFVKEGGTTRLRKKDDSDDEEVENGKQASKSQSFEAQLAKIELQIDEINMRMRAAEEQMNQLKLESDARITAIHRESDARVVSLNKESDDRIKRFNDDMDRRTELLLDLIRRTENQVDGLAKKVEKVENSK